MRRNRRRGDETAFFLGVLAPATAALRSLRRPWSGFARLRRHGGKTPRTPTVAASSCGARRVSLCGLPAPVLPPRRSEGTLPPFTKSPNAEPWPPKRRTLRGRSRRRGKSRRRGLARRRDDRARRLDSAGPVALGSDARGAIASNLSTSVLSRSTAPFLAEYGPGRSSSSDRSRADLARPTVASARSSSPSQRILET